jgi:hypothetical protein
MDEDPKSLLKYIDNDTKIILHSFDDIYVWDSFTGKLINHINVPDYILPPNISPDNTKIIYNTVKSRNQLIEQPPKTGWITENVFIGQKYNPNPTSNISSSSSKRVIIPERIKVIDIRDGKTILDLDVNLVEDDTIKILTFDNTGNFIRCITKKGDYYLFDLNGIKIEQPYLDCNHFYYKQNDGTKVIYKDRSYKYMFSMDGNKVGIYYNSFGDLELTILNYKEENKLLEHLELELYNRNNRTELYSIQIFNYYDIYEKTESDGEDIGNPDNHTIITAIKQFENNNSLILFEIPDIQREEKEHQYIWQYVRYLSDSHLQENVINYAFSLNHKMVAYNCEINYDDSDNDSDNDSVSSNDNGNIKNKLLVKEIQTGEIIAEMSNNNLIFGFFEFSGIVDIAFNEKNTQLICFDGSYLIILEINDSHQSFIPIGIMEHKGISFREINITFPLFVPNNNPESTENTYTIKSNIDRFGRGNPADTIINVDTNEPDFFNEINQKQEQRRSITESKGGKKKTKKNKKNKKTTKRKNSTKKIKSNKNKHK